MLKIKKQKANIKNFYFFFLSVLPTGVVKFMINILNTPSRNAQP